METTTSRTLSISSLPSETLTLIFIHCLRSFQVPFPSSVTVRSSDNTPRRTPIILSSVCNLWRQVACNTPELWSTCWLRYDRPELHSIWLDRAGSHLLHLDGSLLPLKDINSNSGSTVVYSYPLFRFLRSIIPYVKQWASLTLYTDIFATGIESALPYSYQQLTAPELRLLSSLTSPTNAHTRKYTIPPYWLRTIAQQAPKLECLKLSESMSMLSSNKFTNLVTLQFSAHSDNPLLEVLRNAQTLQCLIIRGDSRWHEANPWLTVPPVHVHHPCLSSMRLSNRHLNGFDIFLNSITLPALRSFHWRCTLPWSFASFRLPPFLTRSQSSLHSLHLDCHLGDMESELLISILRHNSVNLSLRDLSLDALFLSRNIVKFFTIGSGSHTINLPRLQRLVLCPCNLNDELERLVAEMVLSRREKREAFERLRYFGYRRRHGEFGANPNPPHYATTMDRLTAYAQASALEDIPLIVSFNNRS